MRHPMQQQITTGSLSDYYRDVEKQLDIDLSVLLSKMTPEQVERFCLEYIYPHDGDVTNVVFADGMPYLYIGFFNIHEMTVCIMDMPIADKLAILEVAERIVK